MRILQFSFGDDETQRVELFAEDSVAYTGTHDNNTTRGWLDLGAEPGTEAARERERALAQSQSWGPDPVWGLNEACYASRSRLAVLPAQDLLGQGGAFRMNTPGTVEANWAYRLDPGSLDPALAQRLKALAARHARLNGGS